MRTILGLLGVVAFAVIAVLAYQWWAGNNATQLTVLYPTDGATLAGNSVPVRLNASQELKNKLNTPGNQTQIVTYIDDKEVGRSSNLEYTLSAVPPGEHRMTVGISTQDSGKTGVNLNLMPKPVSFTLGGGSGANQNAGSLPPGVSSNYNAEPVAPTPTPVAINVPAATPVPAPAPTAPPALPATGNGGLARANAPQIPVAAVSQPQVLAARPVQPAAIIDGSQTQLVLSNTQVNTDAVIAADHAAQTANHDDFMSVAFRWIGAFYVAAFVVALGVVLLVQRRRS